MGILVSFELADINAHYYLMNIGQGEYEAYLENVNYAIVIESLVIYRFDWSYTGEKPKDFEAKYLDKVVFIWQYFGCLRLMPIRHYT